jgi:hypothetical protein
MEIGAGKPWGQYPMVRTLKLTRDQDAWLRSQASARGVSISDVGRAVIAAAMAGAIKDPANAD